MTERFSRPTIKKFFPDADDKFSDEHQYVLDRVVGSGVNDDDLIRPLVVYGIFAGSSEENSQRTSSNSVESLSQELGIGAPVVRDLIGAVLDQPPTQKAYLKAFRLQS